MSAVVLGISFGALFAVGLIVFFTGGLTQCLTYLRKNKQAAGDVEAQLPISLEHQTHGRPPSRLNPSDFAAFDFATGNANVPKSSEPVAPAPVAPAPTYSRPGRGQGAGGSKVKGAAVNNQSVDVSEFEEVSLS
ncbi:hypothetical protein F4818DRAFT_442643 [Hypoxylon cercidicola]|nr:hypothetical protein F4818DRAFT_442643 [Hypoxylon cercidicola]